MIKDCQFGRKEYINKNILDEMVREDRMSYTLVSVITLVMYSNFMLSKELFVCYHFIPRKKYF